MDVKEENKGARKTQTLRMSMVMWKKCRTWYRTAEVIISPVREKSGRQDLNLYTFYIYKKKKRPE